MVYSTSHIASWKPSRLLIRATVAKVEGPYQEAIIERKIDRFPLALSVAKFWTKAPGEQKALLDGRLTSLSPLPGPRVAKRFEASAFNKDDLCKNRAKKP